VRGDPRCCSRIDTQAKTLTIAPTPESTALGSVRPLPQAPSRTFFKHTREPSDHLLLKSTDQDRRTDRPPGTGETAEAQLEELEVARQRSCSRSAASILRATSSTAHGDAPSTFRESSGGCVAVRRRKRGDSRCRSGD
jgi:hypothetical protein